MRGEKGKQYARQITNREHLPTKATCVIDFTDEPVIQCDVLVVKDTYNCK